MSVQPYSHMRLPATLCGYTIAGDHHDWTDGNKATNQNQISDGR